MPRHDHSDPYHLVNTIFAERFRIEKQIGEGGMGIVYLAHSSNYADPIAIKVMHQRELEDTAFYEEMLARFDREGQIAHDLHHKHIVPVHEIKTYQNWHFLVMPYLTGGTLHDKRKNKAYFSWQETLVIMKQATSAVEFIHSLGIVHHDIKPSNFVFDGDGNLVLTDFGVAHTFGSTLTHIGNFHGTQLYSSPEALKGNRDDRRNDIYSLGVVLNEMLTGNDPTKLEEPHPNKPPELEAVVQKATALRREDRYPTATALVQALEQAIIQASRTETAYHQSPGYDRVVPNSPLPKTNLAGNFSPTPTAGAISLPQPTPFLSWPLRLAVAIVLILVIAIGSGFAYTQYISWLHNKNSDSTFTSTPPPSPTPSTPQIGQAQSTVHAYYDDWNSKEYSTSYNLLTSDYRTKYSYDSLHSSYEHTRHACMTITKTEMMGNDSVKVTISDDAVEDNMNGSGTITHHYQGYFIVKKEQGIWKLEPHLQSSNSGGTCQA